MKTREDNLDTAASPSSLGGADSGHSDEVRPEAEFALKRLNIWLEKEAIVHDFLTASGLKAIRTVLGGRIDYQEASEHTGPYFTEESRALREAAHRRAIETEPAENAETENRLDSEKWGQRDGYGGRYGALTREEIEGVIADIDAALKPEPLRTEDTASPLVPTEEPELAESLQVKPKKTAESTS